MSEFRATPFLARRAYRRRRLMDLARLLPVLGAIGFILPVMMAGRDPGNELWFARGLELFLGLWAGLIAISVLVGRGLRPALEGPEELLAAEPTTPPDASSSEHDDAV